jgi:hypothetical protein
MTDYNVKHPKLPYDGNYPNMHVYQDASGYMTVRSLEPGKEAGFEVQPTGSYSGNGPDGARVEAVVGKTHTYHGDGHSQTIDGEQDHKVAGNQRSNSDGSRSSETAGDSYSGGGGHSVHASNDSHAMHTNGDSFNTTEGDHVTDHTGDIHYSVTGDYIHSVTGHKIEIVNGEYGINSQDGNMDIQLDNGNFRKHVNGTILIESTQKITFKVGGSTITMTPDNITIVSNRVDINP